MSFILIICSLGTWYGINGHYVALSLPKNFISTCSATWHGFSNRIINPHWLQQDFALSMAVLQQQNNFPQLQGKTDIYSYHQSSLIASDNHWAPRPVFQSYSVFNKKLADENKYYVSGQQRPDNIIFKVEPIDARFPSLEDGASWPLLVNSYQPFLLENDFLFLHKRQTNVEKTLTPLINIKASLGLPVVLPVSQKPLFVTIDLQPAFLGRIATFLFRAPDLEIHVALHDGTEKTFRFIPEMARAGFLISPLVENTSEFTLLYGGVKKLYKKSVREFTINSKGGDNWQWKNLFLIKIECMETPSF